MCGNAWRTCSIAAASAVREDPVDNLADFFTKPLTSKNFYRMRDILMNVPRASDAESLTEKLAEAEDKYAAAVMQAEH